MSVFNRYNAPQIMHKLYIPRKSELWIDDRASARSNGDTSHNDVVGALEAILDVWCTAFSIKNDTYACVECMSLCRYTRITPKLSLFYANLNARNALRMVLTLHFAN
uniref:AlNc14C87G5560 protein n=1 Tax=Albugo laibachii Nc14 TaxID=890382 RepID=F0WG28_9STRA|nr:AlNc14C87G5560 [Albugo laibachii Nc14]|eukprot:CCA20162.1 AlNc14C87G5560 [Albugo laibachii Nc14]